MKFALGWRSVLAVALAAIFIHLPFQPFVQPASADELPVIILVRHADKAAQPADDPPLTEAGAKRAQDLAAALRTAGVASIITTQLRRTRETAQPLAKALGIAPEVINVGQRALVANPTADALFPPEVIKERAEYIKTLELAVRHRSSVVLVVGHDWSVPGLIASLGGPQLSNICSSVYDNLFVLTSARGNVNLIHARYGAPTPEVDCK